MGTFQNKNPRNFSLSNFLQLHCHKSITTFFPLPFRQQHCHKSIATIFFPSHFGNSIITNFFPINFRPKSSFFSPSFLAISLPKLLPKLPLKFFPHNFGNLVATIGFFFFHLIFGNLVTTIGFSLSLSLFPSHFQQLGCHNSYFLSLHSPRISAT